MNDGAVERFYRRFAGLYDLVFDRIMHPGRVAAVEAMELLPGRRVLEVGVGTGLNLPLYPDDIHVTGIDRSGAMLAKARRRADELPGLEVELLEMDAEHLALPDDSFDCVYAPYVVSVVSRPQAAIHEMSRVCRPGGILAIVNHFHSDHPVGAWFERRFSPLAHHVGFRLDLPVRQVLDGAELDVRENRRVNLMGLWRLLVLRKPLEGTRASETPALEPAGDLVSTESSAGA